MRTNQTTTKKPRIDDLPLEPESNETEEPALIEILDPVPIEKLSMQHRKQEAAKPLYLVRYE